MANLEFTLPTACVPIFVSGEHVSDTVHELISFVHLEAYHALQYGDHWIYWMLDICVEILMTKSTESGKVS